MTDEKGSSAKCVLASVRQEDRGGTSSTQRWENCNQIEYGFLNIIYLSSHRVFLVYKMLALKMHQNKRTHKSNL